ncbi:MAG: RNA polymerase sigma factor [Longimicrobiales bacterium]
MTTIADDALRQRDVDDVSGHVSSIADARRAAAGDAGAFERLYRAHVARIHSLVRRMVDPEEADDLTQEIFVRAWERLGSFRGEAEFGTWLHRLAVNHCLSRRTRFARLRARFPLVAPPPGSRTRSARPDVRMDVERAIASLPPGARRVFVLHDVEGYRHDEIADLMGISVGTSKSQLHRARMELRGKLE